jgi:DNA-directed RNA polymerase specialized sigma24 family protein
MLGLMLGVYLETPDADGVSHDSAPVREHRAAWPNECDDGGGPEGSPHEALDRLPDEVRLPLLLCDVEQLTYGQIGQMLGIPVGAVRARISRGRQRLRPRQVGMARSS